MSYSIKIKTAAFALAASLLASASPAAAAIFTYNQTNGDVLTINSTTGTGTLIGASINASFTSPSLTGFTGGAAPRGTYNLTDLTGRRLINGRWYTDNTTHQQQIVFGTGGSVNLWSYWGRGSQYGDYVTYVGGYTPPHTSTSSTTGGTTTGGSTGGTPVPEPEMLGLFAVGLAGIGLARRRRRNSK